MADCRPIGVFDSGVGGLTVWSQIVSQLPYESTIYLADSKHCPYGPRQTQEIIALSVGIIRFLLARGCKMVVVACNTASAAALTTVRARFSVPIIGLEPATKPAALATKTGHIGVLATEGTLNGSLFKNTAQVYASGVTVHRQVAHGLVALAESGQLSGVLPETLLQQYLQPMLAAGIDQLVLGCTHYPFFIPLIRQIAGDRVTILDPAEAVARQVSRLLSQHSLSCASSSTPTHKFCTTGAPQILQKLLATIGYSPGRVEQVAWTDSRLY
jgi:glutamate racemase